METFEILELLDQIKALYKSGGLSHNEAVKWATPFINKLNEKAAESAKRIGIEPAAATFTSFMS